MKNYFSIKPLKLKPCAIFLIATVSCSENEMSIAPETFEEKVVVTNRGAGSISFVDAMNNSVSKTLSIPNSEPMYVVYVPQNDKLYIGDRMGKKVHIINPKTQEVEHSISIGNGVFHMWADGLGKELWVTNDIDNTISVINLATSTVSNTINVDMKPHDVFLTKDGTTAFVSVFTGSSTADKVYRYSLSSYTKTGEVSVGKEPHLFHLSNSNNLYIPCQSGKLYVVNPNTMSVTLEKDYSNAHGIFASPDQSKIFVSNITGNQLFSINSTSGEQISSIPSAAAIPHNITANNHGDKMFVTHSGAAGTVSVYNINSAGTLSNAASFTTAANPFGIVYYKRKTN
ncbi:40-residue YVTN family beta-propeller repeat-containing protein [Chryseobacterium sp. RU37D]|uniref:YncE family protein n=1 Tax=Chryseobacterium sp. RU37D TaxID=1907397 RepID=UPI000954E8AF|nr:YncE family protein [Chryseobacterium sp. RU37D]SIQ23774.1 40-residue YVTN family beta-propeller repeat-containing protein [Chryseobacterium sp. RU37D]